MTTQLLLSEIPLATTPKMYSIYDAKYHHGYQVRHHEHASTDEAVQLYTAVIGRTGKLINILDYVSFEYNDEVQFRHELYYVIITMTCQQVLYGQLDHSMRTINGQKISLVRLFQMQHQ